MGCDWYWMHLMQTIWTEVERNKVEKLYFNDFCYAGIYEKWCSHKASLRLCSTLTPINNEQNFHACSSVQVCIETRAQEKTLTFSRYSAYTFSDNSWTICGCQHSKGYSCQQSLSITEYRLLDSAGNSHTVYLSVYAFAIQTQYCLHVAKIISKQPRKFSKYFCWNVKQPENLRM